MAIRPRPRSSAIRPLYRNTGIIRALFDAALWCPVQSYKKKKPTAGSVSEVGCLRCDLCFAYRAIPPHCGALLQQQQRQMTDMIL
jgi:hypothetical protein